MKMTWYTEYRKFNNISNNLCDNKFLFSAITIMDIKLINLILYRIKLALNHQLILYFFIFSIWLCCFTMTVSIGAVLLLPFSIFSNEILLSYQSSFYMKWLNDSLIHGKNSNNWINLFFNSTRLNINLKLVWFR